MTLQELKKKISDAIGWYNFGHLITDGDVYWDDLTEEQDVLIKASKAAGNTVEDDFKILTGIEFKAVDQIGEAHDGATIQHIFSLDGKLYAVDYRYSSWDSADVDADEFYPVEAYQKTITAYKKV